MPAKKIKEYLDQNGVKYVTLIHSPAYTAQEVAASAHISGREMAKTVIVKVDGRMAMAVLPADRKVVLQDLRDITGAENVAFATEKEFQQLFPDCEVGAMPPFGNLYGLDVFVAPSLAEDDQIGFNAGTHTEVIQMAYRDFDRLVKPIVTAFTT
ncbi:MAG TPA: YbaK/EbsC family protein [Verrucomicrobiae bacterium]|jgi:Ala-tRNA(Pro) deacylase